MQRPTRRPERTLRFSDSHVSFPPLSPPSICPKMLCLFFELMQRRTKYQNENKYKRKACERYVSISISSSSWQKLQHHRKRCHDGNGKISHSHRLVEGGTEEQETRPPLVVLTKPTTSMRDAYSACHRHEVIGRTLVCHGLQTKNHCSLRLLPRTTPLITPAFSRASVAARR